MSLDIIYELDSLDRNNREIIKVQLKGIIINYENKNYIISVHQGLPIKKVIINDKEYSNYIYCAWNDLIIIPIDNIPSTFVFKHFVKKQMDFNNVYSINNFSAKFIKTAFAPIKMIPNNPHVMYNIFKCKEHILPGEPILDNNKLCGIACKFENDHIFTIPINYIIKSLTKKDNKNIYTIYHDLESITKINNIWVGILHNPPNIPDFYNTQDIFTNIYFLQNLKCCKGLYVLSQYHKNYIHPECFIAFYGDEDYKFNITTRNINRIINSEIFKNNIIDNSDSIIIKDNTIKLTSGLLHYLKIIGEQSLIKLIFTNESLEIKYNNYEIIT